MPTWIRVIYRRIVCVGVPIPRLDPLTLRNDCIRLGEASQSGIVPAGVVEHQPKPFGHSACGWVVHVGESLPCVECSSPVCRPVWWTVPPSMNILLPRVYISSQRLSLPLASVVMLVLPRGSPRKYSTLMLCEMVYLRMATLMLLLRNNTW